MYRTRGIRYLHSDGFARRIIGARSRIVLASSDNSESRACSSAHSNGCTAVTAFRARSLEHRETYVDGQRAWGTTHARFSFSFRISLSSGWNNQNLSAPVMSVCCRRGQGSGNLAQRQDGAENGRFGQRTVAASGITGHNGFSLGINPLKSSRELFDDSRGGLAASRPDRLSLKRKWLKLISPRLGPPAPRPSSTDHGQYSPLLTTTTNNPDQRPPQRATGLVPYQPNAPPHLPRAPAGPNPRPRPCRPERQAPDITRALSSCFSYRTTRSTPPAILLTISSTLSVPSPSPTLPSSALPLINSFCIWWPVRSSVGAPSSCGLAQTMFFLVLCAPRTFTPLYTITTPADPGSSMDGRLAWPMNACDGICFILPLCLAPPHTAAAVEYSRGASVDASTSYPNTHGVEDAPASWGNFFLQIVTPSFPHLSNQKFPKWMAQKNCDPGRRRPAPRGARPITTQRHPGEFEMRRFRDPADVRTRRAHQCKFSASFWGIARGIAPRMRCIDVHPLAFAHN
ncbi:hypothetical protein C8F04DRAFT_1202042 [Mycena alexandri]|uniref:Uncharacterized protein n=1 Tax=Mycena alexandri TaxID=1745969 RepID=A0AAD6RWB7_9AGAR|nr:hypothetical protein C8F04DRAFT_1202042 [Mycena alexandri]